jgi:hypothetical protein
MQEIPLHNATDYYNREQPKEGELWRMVGEGRHKRIWANVANENQWYYEEYDRSTRLNWHHLYEITQVNAEGRT